MSQKKKNERKEQKVHRLANIKTHNKKQRKKKSPKNKKKKTASP